MLALVALWNNCAENESQRRNDEVRDCSRPWRPCLREVHQTGGRLAKYQGIEATLENEVNVVRMDSWVVWRRKEIRFCRAGARAAVAAAQHNPSSRIFGWSRCQP